MRILVFQTAYLGDVVLTTPLLRTIKKRYPDCHLAVVVQPQWMPILTHAPFVDELISFDKRGAQSGTARTIAFGRMLRKKKFDLALCPHPSFRSGLILRIAGIPVRVGFDDSSGRGFFNRLIKRDATAHETLRVLSMAQALSIPPEEWERDLCVVPDPKLDPEKIMARFGVDPKTEAFVGIHPGSVWATKRWLPERFAEVAKTVSKMGFPVLVFGTEGERVLVEEVVASAGHDKVRPATGLSLPELISLLSRAAVYITNDSGPMHIACALGVSVVAIFGSTVPGQGYAPVGERSTVVETDRLPCRPCGPHGHDKCPLDHFLCMRKIRARSVLIALRVLIGGFDDTGFLRVLHDESHGI